MLKETTKNEIEEMDSRKRKVTPLVAFAIDAVSQFDAEGMEACEVTGWPDGEPTCSADAAKCAQALRNAAGKLGSAAKVKQRKSRVFMVREVS